MTRLRSRPGNPTVVLAIILTVQLMIVLDASIVITALPADPHRSRLLAHRAVLGAERLHADVRWPAAAGRTPGRPPRPAPRLRRRAQPVRGRLPARRLRAVGGVAARRPRIAGHRRRDRRAVDARAADDHLRRGRRAHARDLDVQLGLRGRRQHRRAARRPAHRPAVVALGPVHQRPDRPRDRGAGPDPPARHRAPARAPRPRRRRDLGRSA